MRNWSEDPYTKKAQAENYLARSVYKLEEIDRKNQILNHVNFILDLGAAPGSWTQYCLQKAPKAKIIAIDIEPLKISHPNVNFIKDDIANIDFSLILNNQKFDLVLSDMAPKTSGISDKDSALSFELAELALNTASEHLKPGGTFVVKLFMGGEFEFYRNELRNLFNVVKQLRPQATRKQSREIFFIAKGMK